MRKLPVIVGSIVAVCLAALGAALMLVDVNQFRGPIQAQIEKSLRRKVALGDLGLKFVPLSIRVDDFAIAEDPAFQSGKPFLSAKELYVRVGLIPLLQKRLEVQSAVLDSPMVELIRSKQGNWNFSTVGQAATPPRAEGSESSISLARLRIENGTVAVTDLQNGKPRTVFDRIALALDDYTLGRRFTAEGSAHLPGTNKDEVTFKIAGTTGVTDLEGSFSLREVTAGRVALSGDGTLQLRGNAFNVKSSLKVKHPRLKKPVEIGSTVQYDRVSAKATVDSLDIRMDRLAAKGRAEAETGSTPVVFRGDVRGDGLPAADLLSIANAFDIGRGMSGTGTISIGVHVEGREDKLACSGTLSASEAVVVPSPGTKPIQLRRASIRLASADPLAGHISAGALAFDPIPLNDVESDFKLAGGILHLNDVRAHAFGGDVAGSMTVERGGPSLKLDANTKLSNVDAKELLAATTAVKVLSGRLSGDAGLQIAPPPGQNIAAGLNGTIRVLLADGQISGVQLLDHLAQVGKFLAGTNTASKAGTSFSKLAGTMRIQSGVARTDDLRLDFDGGNLTATGSANLADETLDLSVAALLTKEVSQRVGGTNVGGYMTTVMASPKGELMIPAKVTGTFSKPHFAPDPTRLIKVRFGSVNSAAGTAQGLLDQFTKPKSAQQQAGKETVGDKVKPFTDLLQSLGKQQKK